jgi:hypothetical protein
VTDDRDPRPAVHPSEYSVAFTPRQVGGFIVLAAIVLAVVRRLRRPRSRA